MASTTIERGLLLLVVLASFTAMSANTADPDLWGHVQYGRDWIRDGAMPATSTYTFTAEGYPWINHENLAELAMAWAYETGGVAGLVLLRSCLALAVIGMILGFNLWRGLGVMTSSLMTLLVAWNLGFHFSYRPQVATMFFLAAMILVIELAFAGWRSRWQDWLPEGRLKTWMRGDEPLPDDLGYRSTAIRLLWLVPPILFLWTNSHGGFLAGLAIYAVLLGFRCLESLAVRGRYGWGLVRRFSLMLAAAAAVTLVNPYSYELIQWMIVSVRNYRPEIDDWGNVQLWSGVGLKFWALVAFSAFSLLASRKPKDLAQVVVLGLVFWQATTHFRHVQVFAILAGFWIGPHFKSAFDAVLLRRGENATPTLPRDNRRPAPRWQLAGIGALALVMLAGLVPRLNSIRVDCREYPVDALQFMADRSLTGRTLVSFDWAQYFIVAMCTDESPLGPLSRVAFDGRFDTCYPREQIDYHFDFLAAWTPGIKRNRSPQAEPFDPTRALRLGHPELVLNRRIEECSSDVMAQQAADWVLLYQDALAQVWGRREIFDDPRSARHVAPELRSIDNDVPTGFARWPALPVVAASQIANRAGSPAAPIKPNAESHGVGQRWHQALRPEAVGSQTAGNRTP